MSDISTGAPSPANDVELAELQRREYGTYRAKAPIRIRGALAFRAGDPVPVGHVTRGVVALEQVETVEDAPSPSATTTEPDDEDLEV